jgi:hypothetical protein
MTDPAKPERGSVNPIFGELLPMASSDERDEGSSVEDAERERWLRDNVPPHHG